MPKVLMCPPALLNQDLSGKTYLITGGNSGIGRVTAEQLLKQGAHVVVACRRPNEVPQGKSLEVLELDLADLESVRKAAK
ncbi:MAG: SDR family NAD(P)-dependent oxidoreductase, partial [Pseudomonadota bacterium]